MATMDWAAIANAARVAFGQSINDWIVASYVQGGTVSGPNAQLTPGLFEEQRRHRTAPAAGIDQRASAGPRRATDRERARERVARVGGRIQRECAWGVPQARCRPRADGASHAGVERVSYCSRRIGRRVPPHRCDAVAATRHRSSPAAGRDATGLDNAVKGLTSWVEASFRDWKLTAQIVGVKGKGPIPTYAPPYVPVGPVVMGDNISGPGQVIAGPRFGRTI
jgi:hypothetical protein